MRIAHSLIVNCCAHLASRLGMIAQALSRREDAPHFELLSSTDPRLPEQGIRVLLAMELPTSCPAWGISNSAGVAAPITCEGSRFRWAANRSLASWRHPVHAVPYDRNLDTRIDQPPSVGLRWLLFLWVGGLAVTGWVSLLPGSTIGSIQGSDKVWHGGSYLLLALPICYLFPGKLRALRAAVGLALYGAMIEVGQLFVPARSFEWGDIFANSTGAFAGLLVSMLLARWMPAPEPAPTGPVATPRSARRLTATRRP